MAVALIYRDELTQYDFGIGHPLRGDRYRKFIPLLKQHLEEGRHYIIEKADPATEEDLLTICDRDYIEFTRDFYHAFYFGQIYDDRFYRYHSSDNMPQPGAGKLEEAARFIIGQAKLAADLIMSGRYIQTIVIGGGTHHAHRNYGEGFCIYNDVAFVARYLLNHYGLERILILDTDAHAGNGTADYFYAEPRVLFVDIHQNPATLYPGSGFANEIGTGAGKGFTINIPLPVNAGLDSYITVFEEIVEPVVREFQPQIIIRNGGSDPHFADGLTELGLTTKGFQTLGQKVKNLTQICEGREIDMIASGYNNQVLPYAWLALISGVTGFPVNVEEVIPVPAQYERDNSLPLTQQVISDVKRYLKDYWKCFR